MALVHNVMLHSFNGICLQAPELKTEDVPDFWHYCSALHDTVAGHHYSEEAVLFPEIENATGVQGIMDGDVQEHRTCSDFARGTNPSD